MNKLSYLKENDVKKLLEHLNKLLANMHVFYSNLRGFHWNIEGSDFFTMHEKLEDLYNFVSDKIDLIAERIRVYGTYSEYRMSNFLKISQIKEMEIEDTQDSFSGLTIITENMRDILSSIMPIKKLADEILDYGCSALLDDFIIEFEKRLWMFGSVLVEWEGCCGGGCSCGGECSCGENCNCSEEKK